MNHVGYPEHKNPSQIMKFLDLVKFRNVQVMFKPTNDVLPGNIQ